MPNAHLIHNLEKYKRDMNIWIKNEYNTETKKKNHKTKHKHENKYLSFNLNPQTYVILNSIEA